LPETPQTLIRISAFLRKEIAEILRQPRLVITLILGPFLILLLFGLGYSAQPFPIRTLFVIPEDSVLRPYIQENVDTFIEQLVYEGMTTDEEAARAEVRSGQIDVAVVVPSQIYETVRQNHQAVFTIYHDEIDPIRARYISSFAELLVREMNQHALRILTRAGQQEVSTFQPDVQAAKTSADALHQAMDNQDLTLAGQQLDKLDSQLSDLKTALIAGGLILGRFQVLSGRDLMQQQQDLAATVASLRQEIQSLQDPSGQAGQEAQARQSLARIDSDLTQLDAVLTEFRGIDPQVLVSPFRVQTKTVMVGDITLVDYYVPGVIAVLLQHLCVTFGALSIVGEQRRGTMELFQASPLSAFEVLTGKYLSYLLFTVVLTAVLTGLLELSLGVPMLGYWAHYALAIVALLLASLGLGFVLSLLAQTTSQAVQYSMLALLVSVFFSGFFLNLELLRPSIRTISWAIPATYAIRLLQDIMLRGRSIDMLWVAVLVAIGAGLSLVAWLLLRRRMART
jgi:ABC-2 type transport system permease protein